MNTKFRVLDIIFVAAITVFIWSSAVSYIGMSHALFVLPDGVNKILLSLLTLLGAYRVAHYITVPLRKYFRKNSP